MLVEIFYFVVNFAVQFLTLDLYFDVGKLDCSSGVYFINKQVNLVAVNK